MVRAPARSLGAFLAVLLVPSLLLPGWAAVALLTAGLVVIFVVQQIWVRNEQRRELIALKLADGNPAEMPDLRLTALVGGGFLLLFIPGLLMGLNAKLGLFATSGSEGFGHWLWFAVDQCFLQGLPDWKVLYGVHLSAIRIESDWGRHVVMASRLLFDIFLVRAVLRTISIRQVARRTLLSVVRGPDLCVRLGTRIVPRLRAALDDPLPLAVRNAAIALGRIGDRSAADDLHQVVTRSDFEFNFGSGGVALRRKSLFRDVPTVRRSQVVTASKGLGVADGPYHPEVRLAAAVALGRLQDERAVPYLLDALDQFRGRSRAATAGLGAGQETITLGDVRRLKRRYFVPVVLSLGMLGHRRSVPHLKRLTRAKNLKVVEQAVRLLGKCGGRDVQVILRHLMATSFGPVVGWAGEAILPLVGDALPDLTRDLVAAVQDEEWTAAEPLIEVMGKSRRPEFAATLIAVLRGEIKPPAGEPRTGIGHPIPFEEAYFVRTRLCEALAELGEVAAVPHIKAAMIRVEGCGDDQAKEAFLGRIRAALRKLEGALKR